MKRFSIFLLALLLTVSLAACGTSGNDTAVPEGNTLTLEELGEKADCALIRPTGTELTDEACRIIDGEVQIAEYSFKINGVDCFLRFAKTDVNTDISGLKIGEENLFADTESENLYIENDELKADRWFTVDGQYIFAALDGGSWDWYAFDAIQSQFVRMEPRNWNSDVPFATYQAMEGSYSNEDSTFFATIDIEYDHIALNVIALQEDGSRIHWDIDSVLEGEDLVYEKESVSIIVLDEETGSTSSTQLEDGGEGSVHIKDGTLTFDNAYSEELKGLVLNRS